MEAVASRTDIEATCQQVRAARSSFFWPMRLLPRDRRHALYAIYACCRALDDIADGDAPAAERMAALAEWEHEINAAFTGTPATPVGRVLQDAARRHGLDKDALVQVIRGMEMDIDGRMVAPSLPVLTLYCQRVAGAVGLLIVAALDSDTSASRAFAMALGEAMQLTNILRDLEEDAARGRLYLPREILEEAGITDTDPRHLLAQPGLADACARIIRLADARYEEAERLLLTCDRRRLRLAVILMAIYRHLLDDLRRAGWPRRERARVRARSLARAVIAAFAPARSHVV